MMCMMLMPAGCCERMRRNKRTLRKETATPSGTSAHGRERYIFVVHAVKHAAPPS